MQDPHYDPSREDDRVTTHYEPKGAQDYADTLRRIGDTWRPPFFDRDEDDDEPPYAYAE